MQFTEEKLGKAEKTEQDPNFEQLVTFCDNTKQNTETILKNMEFILNSNPGSFSLILNYNQLNFIVFTNFIYFRHESGKSFFLRQEKIWTQQLRIFRNCHDGSWK